MLQTSKKQKKTHKYIKKVIMKGRNVNGWRSVDEKNCIVVTMDDSFRKDIKMLLQERDFIKPTDLIRELVKEEADRIKGASNKKRLVPALVKEVAPVHRGRGRPRTVKNCA